MSNLVLDRIKQQTKVPQTRKIVVAKSPIKPMLSPPIDPEVLRKIFMSEIQETPVEVIEPTPNATEKQFAGLEEFAAWYEINREKFGDRQKEPLDTLVQARNMINAGCACQRVTRLEQAERYFKTFWENNQKTDLPLLVAQILEIPSVKIFSRSEMILSYTQ